MSTIFSYIPHPHLEKRAAAGPPTVAQAAEEVHGTSRIGQFNSRLGLKITVVVGTMWAAYVFTVIALISAPSAFRSGNTTIIIAWLSSNFLQLVLLPIIIVGQNIQALAADKRAEATYEDAVAVLKEAQQIQAHLEAQDREIERILAALAKAG